METKKKYRFLISGGGTGGHIFPAISIANALKEMEPDAEFLFVGALGRMEMERIPAAGYPIVGLPIRGFNRQKLLSNFSVLLDLCKSMHKVKKVIRNFQPHIAIGVGGYASGAALKVASQMGIPTLLQEQNSFAGVTNKLLASKAAKICVAYPGMERFFPADKLLLTGNPVRQSLTEKAAHRAEACNAFGFSPDKKTLLIVGGSLGARTINQSVMAQLEAISKADIQVIWQTGKGYIEAARKAAEPFASPRLVVTDFVGDMASAYAVADLVVSRAGASSISELCLLGKASILVPSPNVSEDHQTHNAMALVRHGAAVLVKDAESMDKLIPTALELMAKEEQLQQLRTNSLTLAQHNSAQRIAEEVMKIVNNGGSSGRSKVT